MSSIEIKSGKRIDNYILESQVGLGSSSVVWKARDIYGKRVAIKFYAPNHELSKLTRSIFIEEYNIIKGVTSEHIVKYYKVGIYRTSPYIVSEYCDGSLRNLIGQFQSGNVVRFKDRDIADFISQMSEAIITLNLNGIIHNDLKPENILIKEIGNRSIFKVSDFGVSSSFKKNLKRETVVTNSVQYGFTPVYAAPERLIGKTSKKSDVYSFGIILAELLLGNLPKDQNQINSGLELNRHGLSGQLLSIVKSCMDKDSTNRPSFEELKGWADNYLENKFWGRSGMDSRDQDRAKKRVLDYESNKKNKTESPFGESSLALDKIKDIPSKKEGVSLKLSLEFLQPFSKLLKNRLVRRVLLFMCTGFVLINILAFVTLKTKSYKLSKILSYSSIILLPSFSKSITSLSTHSIDINESREFFNGVSVCSNSNNKWGAINRKGEVIIPFLYDDLLDFTYKDKANTYSIFYKDGKCGFITLKGRISGELFDNCELLSKDIGWHSTVNKYGKLEERPIELKKYFDE